MHEFKFVPLPRSGVGGPPSIYPVPVEVLTPEQALIEQRKVMPLRA